ncbi:hypothetical protein KOR34_23570 [Posidoniimonas corsicana]|uniref:Peptide-N-glycosidase F N-terminal domain-containing protein n=1 Tax=Posidoniimonas corsicana TaxID=1938618 RepID=A0A5C5VHF3_9BACT|nr:peptide-N-glycosidase F-related protein [Posidoniimonas corsicana]TWT37407.1 hypothetical protein KOR34_23570 [Posidoniimonas corsicana]
MLLALLSSAPAAAQTIGVFSNDRIGFADGQSREIQRTITFPEFEPNDRLTFNWDLLGDQDPWDRAGSIHVILPRGEQVQLGKFITGFNGTTSHSQDISDLAPLLSGQTLAIEAHIDTWVADAWRLNASVEVEPEALSDPGATWAAAAIPRDGGLGWHESGDVSRGYQIRVPQNLGRVKLTYFASGHHHTQTGASDEFNQRRHRLSIDGQEVWTGVPWRTDGPDFRSVNPTSGRWDGNGDGDTNDPYPIDQWSSDFPRSGWVPGDEVAPYEIDVTDYVAGGGRKTLTLTIEDVDINSFWRVSAYLSGAPPVLVGDFNDDGAVDAADYTVWRDSLGQRGDGLPADANSSGRVDYADLDLWRENYGQASAGAAAASAPEPAALACCTAAAAGLLCRRQRCASVCRRASRSTQCSSAAAPCR